MNAPRFLEAAAAELGCYVVSDVAAGRYLLATSAGDVTFTAWVRVLRDGCVALGPGFTIQERLDTMQAIRRARTALGRS